jgi:hypothetical protein
MELQARQAYINQLRKRYHATERRISKEELITELVENTGYNRKYAISLLNKAIAEPTKRKAYSRARTYTDGLKAPLKKIWETLNRPCSKRLRHHAVLCVKMDGQ